MKDETKFKLKAFAYVNLIRPFKVIVDSRQLNLLFAVLAFSTILLFKSIPLFIIFFTLLIVTNIYEIIRYFNNGEYMNTYRKEKYPDYMKAMKEIRNAKKETTPLTKDLNSLNNLNTEEIQDEKN